MLILENEKIYRRNPDADAVRLTEIVRVNNDAILRGERCPIVLGHTPGDGATDFLPIDIGSAQNFRTDGEFIYADFVIDDVFADAVRRHKGKSIELWSDNRIFPVSLLAHNRPALELEPVKFSMDGREGEHKTYTTNEQEIEDMDIDAMKNLIAECLNASDIAGAVKSLTETVSQLSIQVQNQSEQAESLKWLFDENEENPDDELDELGEEAAEGTEEAVAEDAAVEAEEHPELPPEEIKQVAENHVAEGKGEEKGEAEKKPEVEEKNDMAMASGTNTMVAGVGGTAEEKPKKKNYEELELESQSYKLAAEAQTKVVEEYQGKIETPSTQHHAALADMERKCQMLQRRNDLIVLGQRYQFDLDSECKLVESMTDEQFTAHKEKVVTKYAMPPIGVEVGQVGDLPKPKVEGEKDPIPKDEVIRVAKYALNKTKTTGKHCTWDEAYRELNGKAPGA